MAFTTYSELQTAITALLNRSDVISALQVQDFITLAEAQMNRRLKTRRQVGRSTATIDSEFVTVPTDFGGPRTMEITGSPNTVLDFVTPERSPELQASLYSESGKPKIYTVIGEEFQFLPPPDSSYTADLTYYKKIPALSDSNTSNWLLSDHPDAYLYGSALQSAPFLKDDVRLGMWGQLFAAILDDINAEDSFTAQGRLNMKPSRVFG